MRGKPQPLERVTKIEDVLDDPRRRRLVTLECGHKRKEARGFIPKSTHYRRCSTCGAAERRAREKSRA